MMNIRKLIAIVGLFALIGAATTAHAYIEVPYSLGRLVNESLYIIVLKVDKLDRERNLIVFSKVKDQIGRASCGERV